MLETPATAAGALLGYKPVARLLPPEEWAEKTPAFAAISPTSGFVVVVEDGGPGGRLLAQWAAFTCAHVEGLEVHGDAQGHAGVARALLSFMAEALAAQGIGEVLTQIDTPEMALLVEHAGGTKIPGDTYMIPIGPASTQGRAQP